MKVIYEYFMRLLEFIPEHDEFEKFLHAILLYLVLYMIYMGRGVSRIFIRGCLPSWLPWQRFTCKNI